MKSGAYIGAESIIFFITSSTKRPIEINAEMNEIMSKGFIST